MARSELIPVKLVPNGSVPLGAGVAGTADGHYFSTDRRTGVRDQVRTDDLMLQVTVANATTKVTVRAGDYPPAIASVQGDLEVDCPVGTTVIGPLESGRFLRNDGRVHVDYAVPANVTIRALARPTAV